MARLERKTISLLRGAREAASGCARCRARLREPVVDLQLEAGAAGWMIADPALGVAGSRSAGNRESISAGPAIAAGYRPAGSGGSGSPPLASAEDVVAAAHAGDQHAQEVLSDASRHLLGVPPAARARQRWHLVACSTSWRNQRARMIRPSGRRCVAGPWAGSNPAASRAATHATFACSVPARTMGTPR
jgi:hypothetical protein